VELDAGIFKGHFQKESFKDFFSFLLTHLLREKKFLLVLIGFLNTLLHLLFLFFKTYWTLHFIKPVEKKFR
jgi:hypothetical protein